VPPSGATGAAIRELSIHFARALYQLCEATHFACKKMRFAGIRRPCMSPTSEIDAVRPFQSF